MVPAAASEAPADLTVDITPLVSESTPLIERYGDEGFTISGQLYRGAILVTPENVETWPLADSASITYESLSTIVRQKSAIELLLIGSGRQQIFLAPALRQALREDGITVECMDSGAASRTFNILIAEGRRVAAALMPLSASAASL